MLNKNNLLLAFVLTLLVNYIGWDYLVIPTRRERVAREFQLRAEATQPPRVRAMMRAKQRKMKHPPLSRKSLIAWEWTYKFLVFSIAPGALLIVLVRRRSFLRIPYGKSVVIGTGLGLVSDTLSLWWLVPATYFYLVALALIARSDPSAYPDADSPSFLARAWRALEPHLPSGKAQRELDDKHKDNPLTSSTSHPPSRTKRFANLKLRRGRKGDDKQQSEHEAS